MNSVQDITRRLNDHHALLSVLTNSMKALTQATESLANQQRQIEARLAQMEARTTEPPGPRH